jgi:hypothetical protein
MAMMVVMDPTKPYTSDGLGPWSWAAKKRDLDELSQSRWGQRLRIRLKDCARLRTTGDIDVVVGDHSIVFLSQSRNRAALPNWIPCARPNSLSLYLHEHLIHISHPSISLLRANELASTNVSVRWPP